MQMRKPLLREEDAFAHQTQRVGALNGPSHRNL
jgi:hypothetical protein